MLRRSPDPVLAAVALALRRLRARRWTALGGALTVAAAVGLLLAVSVLGALAREQSARGRVAELPARERLVQIVARTRPVAAGVLDPLLRAPPPSGLGAPDPAAGPRQRRGPAPPDPATGPPPRTSAQLRDAGVRTLQRLGLGRPVTVLVAGPVSPSDERGTRVVHADAGASRVVSGRAPRRCTDARCEVVALGRRPRIGERVRLQGTRARVVGRAALPPALAPPRRALRGTAVLISDRARFDRLARTAGAWVVSSATLRPGAVPGTAIGGLAERLRAATARVERRGRAATMTTPAARLREIAARARTAHRQLLLLGAQAAALFLAFAALLGVARRREVEALGEQLRGLGAARWQPAFVHLVELGVPACLGAVAALAVSVAATAWVAARRNLDGFLVAALPAEALALVALLVVAAVLIEHATAGRRARRRAGLGPLEVGALACLAAIVWQALSTGGLDASQVAGGDAGMPVLLLVPGLSLFAGGVLAARALPWCFGLAERMARGRGVPVRLALLGLTRGGGLPAAATTFLAVALGGALFALDYRATLRAQVDAQAAFAAGTPWRVVAPDRATVAPLTRFAGVSSEVPVPVLRADARVSAGMTLDNAREATLLAVPGGAIAATGGWTPPQNLARRLRTGARVAGPRLDARARELRLRIRAGIPGTLILELLRPGEHFGRMRLGDVVAGRRAVLRAPLPESWPGAQVVGITLSSALSPRPTVIDLGALEQRVPGPGWSRVDGLRSWRVVAGRFGDQGRLRPLGPGVRATIPESETPLLRPDYPVPRAIPALASEPLAREAVDGLLTATVRGRTLPVRVVATSALLPTVTQRPDRFLLVDYHTLVAVVTAQRPGEARPTEAWFAGPGSSPAGPAAARAVARSGPTGARVVSRTGLTAAARRDALASGASTALAVTAALASLLAAAGLLLAAGSALRAERGELAGWHALGAGPRALARAVRLRVLALYAAGTVAALAGAALALRLVVALVAVTAGGGAPLPPIELRVDWTGSALLIAATGTAAAVVATAVGRLALRRLSDRRVAG